MRSRHSHESREKPQRGGGAAKRTSKGGRGHATSQGGRRAAPKPKAQTPSKRKDVPDEKAREPRKASPKLKAKGPGKKPAQATRPSAQKPPVRVPLSPPRGGIQTGDWLFTTREGSEQDLIDELVLAGVVEPPAHKLAPALVVSPRWPKRDRQLVPVTFARQALPVLVSVKHDDWNVMVERLVKALVTKLENASQYALHVWVPDSTVANPLASTAEELEKQLVERLSARLPKAKRVDDASLRRLASMPFAQVCLVTAQHAVAGVLYSNQALSLAPGGRTRVRVTGDLPSRAARKIEEALAWLGVAPGPGEVCVDLGAAPGGWTYVLSDRRARVIAIDPGALRPEILARKNVEHLRENAFTYVPKEPVDWLFCDMAYRPLEVAALLARWGRRRWARMLVANIKLPMKKKAEILARVRGILENEGEWKHVKTRQLYHDRDEITVTAIRGV